MSLINYLKNFLLILGQYAFFVAEFFFWLFRPPFQIRETIKVMKNISFQCLIPVVSVVAPAGMVITLQGLKIFDLFGAHRLMSSLLAEVLFRELAPMLASIMVAAQAGTAIAGELGTMRVKEEIDALEIMSVNPFQYLIIPRLIALALICPLLNIIASISGIAGGYLVAVIIKGQSSGVFIENMFSFLKISLIWGGMIKAIFFGIIVGTISCFKGYQVKGGETGVGKAANSTVVQAILLIVVVNYFLTSALIAVLV